MGETQAAARMLGFEVAPLVIQRAEDIAPVFQGLKTRADALYVAVDQLMVANRSSILASALDARMPTIFSTRDFVKAGALMSYGPSYTERFGRAAYYVDKILRGANPADLPVEQPTKFELVINNHDCQGAWPRCAAASARSRRRGDRMRWALFLCNRTLRLGDPHD